MNAQILVGYARVSTRGQDLRAQRSALRRLGVSEDRIYTDHGYSGRKASDRPGLEAALAACRQGDTLIVTKLDRLGRSVTDLRRIAAQLEERGTKLSYGGSTYDPTDPAGKLFFTILAAMAEFEADLISARTREGLAEARRQGRLAGRKPKLTPLQIKRLVADYESGDYSTTQLCELYGVARSTLYDTLKRQAARDSLRESD